MAASFWLRRSRRSSDGEADGVAEGGEALVGVVGAEGEAEFGAAGEHAVGFGGGFGDEVVDHDADVGLVAGEDEAVFALDFAGGVDAGDEALAGGFFVAGGAVDLAGEEEAFDEAGFEGCVDLMGGGEVVFDGVAEAEDFGVFEAFDGADDFGLHIFGEAGGDAVAVDFVGVEAFGFEEDLVGVLVGEADDFVFDGGAIAWAAGGDLAGVHGGAVEVLADEVVDLLVGVGDVHGELGEGSGEGGGMWVRSEKGVGCSSPGWVSSWEKSMDLGGEAWGGSGFEAAEFEAEVAEGGGHSAGGLFVDAAAFGFFFAGVHEGGGGRCRW